MKLSTKTRYGLRILLQIAYDTENNPKASVKGKSISEKQDVSEAYLEQIMIPFKTAGFIKTVRGCNGGYALNKTPEQISVLDVIELFEGKINLVKCNDESEKCDKVEVCPVTRTWTRISDALRKEASSITLAYLLEEMKKGTQLDYVI